MQLSQKVPIAGGVGGAAVFAALGLATGTPVELAGLALAPLGLGWAAFRLRAAKKRLPLVLPLDAAARAVAEAYRELGELTPEAAGSLTIEPRAAGYLRVELTKATPAEGHRFAAALDELVGVSDAPRYLVSRPLADPRRGALGLLGRVLTRRAPFDERLHPVAEGPGAQQGARGGLRPRLEPPGRPRAARVHAAVRGRPRGARRGGLGRRRLRDAGQGRLGLSGDRVLGRVLAVLGGAVGGVGDHVAWPGAPVREGRGGLFGRVAPGVQDGAPTAVTAQHDLPRVGHAVEEGSEVVGAHRESCAGDSLSRVVDTCSTQRQHRWLPFGPTARAST